MRLQRAIVHLVLLLLFFNLSCSTAQEVPEAVKVTFKKKYPGENDPDWHKDSNGNYESHFKKKGKHFRADFSPEGNWIETERSIDKDELPKPVKDWVKHNKDLGKITEIEEVDHHTKGRFYDIEFKRDGKNKDYELSPNGNVLN